MGNTRWVRGTHLVIDDLMGRRVLAKDCRMRWDGVLVRKEDWEPRHPQDFLESRPERQDVANPTPETVEYESRPVTVDDL